MGIAGACLVRRTAGAAVRVHRRPRGPRTPPTAGRSTGRRAASASRRSAAASPRARRRAARAPCTTATSAMASSRSFRKIWPIPARASGFSARSRPASGCGPGRRRGAARTPPAVGGSANSTKLGKNGGTVFGKITSPTMPSSFCCSSRSSRVPVPDAQVGVLQVLERVLVLPPPGVELVAVLRVEVLAVLRVASTGVAVGGDDDVPIIPIHDVPLMQRPAPVMKRRGMAAPRGRPPVRRPALASTSAVNRVTMPTVNVAASSARGEGGAALDRVAATRWRAAASSVS